MSICLTWRSAFHFMKSFISLANEIDQSFKKTELVLIMANFD